MGRPHLRHGEKPPYKTLEEVSGPSEEQTGHLLGYSRRVCLPGPRAGSPVAEQNSPLSPQVINGNFSHNGCPYRAPTISTRASYAFFLSVLNLKKTLHPGYNDPLACLRALRAPHHVSYSLFCGPYPPPRPPLVPPPTA